MTVSPNPWFTKPLSDFIEEEHDPSHALITPLATRHNFTADAAHEHFHERTKYHRGTNAGVTRNIRNFLSYPNLIARGAASQRDFDPSSALDLPDALDVDCNLTAAMAARTSVRRGELRGAISAAELSTILQHGVRANRLLRPSAAPTVAQWVRPYPSGGALYPIELYVAASAVEGVPVGVSSYNAVKHKLQVLPHASPDAVRAAETGYEDHLAAPCVLVLTGVFERSIQKYGPRGYRLALIEAGHMMQNIILLVTALGLKACVSASFYEAEMERALDIDGVSEAALVLVIIGGRS